MTQDDRPKNLNEDKSTERMNRGLLEIDQLSRSNNE
jgi:hypothetical protein